MGKTEKILEKIISGTSDRNIAFADLQLLMKKLGFEVRIRGDHHIYVKNGIEEIINLQPIGAKAKVYQVKQVRGLIVRYKLSLLR